MIEKLNGSVSFVKLKNEDKADKGDFDVLETTFYSIHSNHKLMQKKILAIEDLLTGQRKDYFSQLTEIEKYFISKNETIKQAIGDICRSLNIINPLI